MEKIEAYKLSNGQVVDNLAEAKEKQKGIDFENAALDFAEKYGYYEGKDQIKAAIIDHADELLAILNLR